MARITQTSHAARNRIVGGITTALGAAFLLTGCSFGPPDQIEVTTQVTTTETEISTTTRVERVTETETTTQTPPPPPAAPEATPQPPVEVPAPDNGAGGPAAPRGYTGAPGTEPIRELDKQIDRCGISGVHERGTTFFTDDTSGWTEHCAAVMG